jgi:hypothetical protein
LLGLAIASEMSRAFLLIMMVLMITSGKGKRAIIMAKVF